MSLSAASSTLLRTCARQQLPTARAAVTSCQQTRGVADAKASFESPFATANERGSTLKIPNFSKYQSNKSPRSNQVFSYFMAGTMGLATAVGAKATVQGTFSVFDSFVLLRLYGGISGGIGWIPTIIARDEDYRD